ncbi:MAG: VOC family protein [Desulfobacterales bacterium]|jgi:methylmalonyl-CoA/ethylmalonyl-CoA epimerase
MIKAVGHLGIVIKDIEASLNALSKIIDIQSPAIKEFPEKKMKCAVVEFGGIGLEFIQDSSEDGMMAEFIKEKGDGIHHFCLLTDNIEDDVEILKQRGIEMLDQKPRIGLRGKMIAFTQPSALNGIMIELSEP